MYSAALRVCLAASLAASLAACGTLYELDVTAHKHEDVPGSTYVILSGDPDLPMDSREFVLYSAQLEHSLAAHGYERVDGNRLADATVAVYLAADIGDPRKTYHSVSRAIYESPYMEGTQAAARESGNSGGNQSGQSSSKPTVLDRPPQQELAGYTKNSFATTVYTKHLSIVAVDLQDYLADVKQRGRENAVPKELWSVDVQTTGSPDDLGESVPVMIAAGEPYLGASTGDTVRVSMNEGDERVRRTRHAAEN